MLASERVGWTQSCQWGRSPRSWGGCTSRSVRCPAGSRRCSVHRPTWRPWPHARGPQRLRTRGGPEAAPRQCLQGGKRSGAVISAQGRRHPSALHAPASRSPSGPEASSPGRCSLRTHCGSPAHTQNLAQHSCCPQSGKLSVGRAAPRCQGLPPTPSRLPSPSSRTLSGPGPELLSTELMSTLHKPLGRSLGGPRAPLSQRARARPRRCFRFNHSRARGGTSPNLHLPDDAPC